MPMITRDKVRGLPDIMSTDHFEFIIGAIPGGTTDRSMVIKCQQATYPGVSNEMMEVTLHGYTVRFRGRKLFPGTLSVTYVDDVTKDTSYQLLAWSEFTVGTMSGTSAGYKEDYSTNSAELIEYDTTGAEVDRIRFFGLFLQDKPDITLDGSSTQPYIINATFSYDYAISSIITVR